MCVRSKGGIYRIGTKTVEEDNTHINANQVTTKTWAVCIVMLVGFSCVPEKKENNIIYLFIARVHYSIFFRTQLNFILLWKRLHRVSCYKQLLIIDCNKYILLTNLWYFFSVQIGRRDWQRGPVVVCVGDLFFHVFLPCLWPFGPPWSEILVL